MSTLMDLVEKGLLASKDAAAQVGISEEAFLKKMADQKARRKKQG